MNSRRDINARMCLNPSISPRCRIRSNVLEIDDLHTYFFTDVGTAKAVDGVTFEVPQGKTVGVVGESGCGKSVTSLSVMQLLQRPQGQIVDGSIRINLGDKAYDITKHSDRSHAEAARQLRKHGIPGAYDIS